MTSRVVTSVVLAAAAVLAGCGEADTGNPIPSGKAATLQQQLDAVGSAVDDSRCDEVGPAVSRLQTTIATLGSDGVGDDVQNALGDGADNLRSLAVGECQPEEEPVETTPETVPTTPPAPTETTPPPTTTVPPTTTTPPPTTTTPTEPPADEGGGEGQFDPNDDGGVAPPGQLKKQGKIK